MSFNLSKFVLHCFDVSGLYDIPGINGLKMMSIFTFVKTLLKVVNYFYYKLWALVKSIKKLVFFYTQCTP